MKMRRLIFGLLTVCVLTVFLSCACASVIISDSITIGMPEETLPEAMETIEPETQSPVISIRQFYLAPGARRAANAERLNASLVLEVSNANQTELNPFGIQFGFSDVSDVEVNASHDGENARFSGDTLWVDHGVASGGRVEADGRAIELSISFVPFTQDSTAERAVISYQLLDADGRAVSLSYSEESGNIIRRRMTVARIAADDGELPADELADEDVALEDAEPTPQPSESLAPQETPMPKQLLLHASNSTQSIQPGDTLVLTAELIGYDNEAFVLQWQQRKAGVWDNLDGENGMTLSVLITDENRRDAWRYEVTVLQKDEAAE